MRIVCEKTLDLFRNAPKCEWCRAANPGKLHPHHLYCRGMGGGGRLDLKINLCALCAECHDLHHDGHWPQTFDLLAIVAAREATTQDELKRAIRDIRRLPKGSSREQAEALLPKRRL